LSAPPNPIPSVVAAIAKAKASAEADQRQAMIDAAQLKSDQLTAHAKRTAELAASLTKAHADQQDYGHEADTALGQPNAGKPEPPPMLPMRDIRADQPASSLMSQQDLGQQFQSLLANGGGPELANGGAGVRSIQGSPVGGPPQINMPAPQLPVPNGQPPTTANPTYTDSSGQSYTAPSFVPSTSAQMSSKFDYSTGQAIPVRESGVSTEMKPNVLSPGDILQARIAQERMANERSYQQMSASIDWAKAKTVAVDALASHVGMGVALKVGPKILNGDLVGAAEDLKGVKTYEQQNIDIHRAVAAADIAKSNAQAAEARNSINEQNARTNFIVSQTQNEAIKTQILKNAWGGGPGGMGPNAANTDPIMVLGLAAEPKVEIGENLMPKSNAKAIQDRVFKGQEALAKAVNDKKMDLATLQLNIQQAGQMIGNGGDILVYSGKSDTTLGFGGQTRYGVKSADEIVQLYALALGDPAHVQQVPPKLQAAARAALESYHLAKFDPDGAFHLPPENDEMRGWAEKLYDGYRTGPAQTGDYIANTITSNIAKLGHLDNVTAPPKDALPGQPTASTSPEIDKWLEIQSRANDLGDGKAFAAATLKLKSLGYADPMTRIGNAAIENVGAGVRRIFSTDFSQPPSDPAARAKLQADIEAAQGQ
jgi:hypothetical protein